MTNLKVYLLGLITFILSGWELYASVLNGEISILSFLFLITGLVGAMFCFLNKIHKIAKWLLGVFYFIQLIFIYSESFSFKFVASFAFPIHYFFRNEGNIQQTFNNPTGLGINLFALVMLFVIHRVFKVKTAT
ncbi:hypothetical protein EXT46_05735 [Pseudoalteromonas sp. CO325X]|uniref:hypothetical protein n=1 Tax=Pseudoalteromonas sp. CO325X TaxID=1777262 RepID=UPI001022A628|nr:hypothetical protein [Pseudoalteromonas sp. CO325X]RZF82952.1 hypothetical protein EXT46_05735 [Pseudoalteromonas sp. CO325X]